MELQFGLATPDRRHLETYSSDKLHFEADYGLGDPAETGRLYGLFMPLQYAGLIPATVSLNSRPDFTKPSMKGSFAAVFRVTLAALLIPVRG